jgi:phosphoserine phosphatase RsbX
LAWSSASVPLEGQQRSGDLALVHTVRGNTLVAVIDGLGHGEEAAAAASAASDAVLRYSPQPLERLMELCHQDVARTRGVVMTIATIAAGGEFMHWLGVGNVGAVVVHADPGNGPQREWALLFGGVIGYRLPVIRPSTVTFRPGDVLVMATDGLDSSFGDAVSPTVPSQRLLKDIFDRHHKGTDDALVLAASRVSEQ